MSEEKELQLKNLISSQAAVEASGDLRQRISALAGYHDSSLRHRRAHVGRIRFAFAASLSGIAVLAVIALSPSMVSAHTLNIIVAAVDSAKSMHFTMVDVSKSAPYGSYEEWVQDGAFRIRRANGETTLWLGSTKYVYSPSAKTVIKSTDSRGRFSHGAPAFKMSSILQGMTDARRTPAVVTNTIDSASYRVQVDNKPVGERYLFTVDSKTDLPRTMDVERQEDGVWIVKAKGTIQFNDKLAPELLSPNFSLDAKVIDADIYTDSLSKQFQKTLATVSLPTGHSLSIQDAQASTKGDVFLMYAGSGLSGDHWAELTDERGTKYMKVDKNNGGGFQDTVLWLGNKTPVIFEWWIPIDVSPSFRPHTYTLRFKTQKRVKLNKPGTFYDSAIEDFGKPASFKIDHPTTADVPAYAPIIVARDPSVGVNMPTDDADVQRVTATAMCRYLQQVWLDKSGKPVETMGFGGFATYNRKVTGYRRDIPSLEKAYGFANQEVAIDDAYVKVNGLGTANYQGYIDLFQISTLLGRTEEAAKYLEDIRKYAPKSVTNELRWRDFEMSMGNIPAKP